MNSRTKKKTKQTSSYFNSLDVRVDKHTEQRLQLTSDRCVSRVVNEPLLVKPLTLGCCYHRHETAHRHWFSIGLVCILSLGWNFLTESNLGGRLESTLGLVSWQEGLTLLNY